jgi:hypothetical protein
MESNDVSAVSILEWVARHGDHEWQDHIDRLLQQAPDEQVCADLITLAGEHGAPATQFAAAYLSTAISWYPDRLSAHLQAACTRLLGSTTIDVTSNSAVRTVSTEEDPEPQTYADVRREAAWLAGYAADSRVALTDPGSGTDGTGPMSPALAFRTAVNDFDAAIDGATTPAGVAQALTDVCTSSAAALTALDTRAGDQSEWNLGARAGLVEFLLRLIDAATDALPPGHAEPRQELVALRGDADRARRDYHERLSALRQAAQSDLEERRTRHRQRNAELLTSWIGAAKLRTSRDSRTSESHGITWLDDVPVLLEGGGQQDPRITIISPKVTHRRIGPKKITAGPSVLVSGVRPKALPALLAEINPVLNANGLPGARVLGVTPPQNHRRRSRELVP